MNLIDSPATPLAKLILAHGAGAGMEHPFMAAIAQGIKEQGVEVVRFNFDYMTLALETNKRRPPESIKKLLVQYQAKIDEHSEGPLPLFIGGKSMGGRVSTMLLQQSVAVAGICFGYPFHPPGKPVKLRVEHLQQLEKPLMVVQGERDTFGTKEEVPKYALPSNIQCRFVTDGDHSLKPRKASGLTEKQNIQTATAIAVEFIKQQIQV